MPDNEATADARNAAWKAREQDFKARQHHLGRVLSELPFGAVLTLTIKIIIAFWLGNLLIAGALLTIIALFTGGLAGLSDRLP